MDNGRSPANGMRAYGEPLSVSVERAGDRAIVTLDGELDLSSVDAFAAVLSEASGPDTERIEIDARELTFVDSAGLQALLVARRVTVASGGSFVLRHTSVALKRMLELAGLAEIFSEPDTQ